MSILAFGQQRVARQRYCRLSTYRLANEYNAGRIPRLCFVGRTMLIVNYSSNYASPMPSFHSSYLSFGFVYARLFGSETDPGIYDLHTAAASLGRPVVARDSARFSRLIRCISAPSPTEIYAPLQVKMKALRPI